MRNKYSGFSLAELYNMQNTVIPGRDARQFHKALKKYGEGLAICYRYPDLALVISAAAAILFVVSLIVAVLI